MATALLQVFLLVLVIVIGAIIFGLSLCRMADDGNDDEQQLQWIHEQQEKNRQRQAEKERKRKKRRSRRG